MATFRISNWRTSPLVGDSLLLIILLVLLGELRKHGSGVKAWHHKYCFTLMGNEFLNTDKSEEVALNSSGYTGFGHDVYYTKSFETSLYSTARDHSKEFTQDVFHVKEKNGKILFGWFHIKLTNIATIFSIHSIVSQADSFHNIDQQPAVYGIGEFVNHQLGNKGDCESKMVGDKKPIPDKDQVGKKNRIPCNYVKNPFHLTAGGLGLKSDIAIKSFSTNFRMGYPPCGFYRKDQYPLSFRTAVFTLYQQGLNVEDQAAHVKTPVIFFKNHVYGAPDPPPPKDAEMECNIGLMDASGTPTASSWVDSIEPNQRFADVSYFFKVCNYNKTGANQLFYGRCSENKALDSPPYTCGSQYTNTYYEKLPTHIKALEISTKATECNKHCNEVLKNITFNGISANSEIGKEVWALRKAHGIGMTFVTTFFIPWNNFNTRYMKETYMEKKLAHLPVWYMTHFILTTNIVGVLLASYAATIWGRTFFGYSMTVAGRAHVSLGWISTIVFVLTYFSSGFRCNSTNSRYWSIFFHFMGGMIHYALSIAGMLTSCFVPGSPSGFSDTNISGTQFEPLFLGAIIWILIDTVFHIGMMKAMKYYDGKMPLKSKRKFAIGVVPIPVQKLDSTRDIPGAPFRKCMYVLYVFLAFCLSLGISAVILQNSSEHRYFGRTTQIHKDSGKLIGIWKFVSFDA